MAALCGDLWRSLAIFGDFGDFWRSVAICGDLWRSVAIKGWCAKGVVWWCACPPRTVLPQPALFVQIIPLMRDEVREAVVRQPSVHIAPEVALHLRGGPFPFELELNISPNRDDHPVARLQQRGAAVQKPQEIRRGAAEPPSDEPAVVMVVGQGWRGPRGRVKKK